MKPLMIVVTVSIALTGCAFDVEKRQARAQIEAGQMMQAYGPACEKLGFKPHTEAWSNCLLRFPHNAHYNRH